MSKDTLEAIGEFTEVNNHRIHVLRIGNPDKPKLLFMAGSSTVVPAFDFKVLYEKLQNDYRIIVIEKFGYGYSDICECDCDIDSLLDIQREALKKLGETGPFILLPHSMSGIEAIHWIQKYPDEVSALIGIDMTSDISYSHWSEEDVEKRVKLLRTMKKFGLYKLSTVPKNKSLTDKDKEQIKLLQKRNAFNVCYGREAEQLLHNASVVRDSGTIKCPALLFSSNGKQTFKNWVEDQKELANLLGAKLICYDCGHYIHYYKSSEMSEEIREFIDKEL